MGCGTSSAGGVTSADNTNDMDFTEVKTRKNENCGDEDFFEAVTAEGESFMATLPWKGQVIEPDNHLPLKPEKPSINYDLEYVYGYRTYNSRNNVYFNKNGCPTYFSAAVGIILDTASNTQKFFGGGEVDTEKNNNKNDVDCHNDDIECLAMSEDRCVAVTGQRGPNAAIFCWNTETGEKMCRMKASKSKAIVAIDISCDNKFIAAVDGSNDHNVWVFQMGSEQPVMM
jgi:microtubule-associated protein-like 6